MKQALRCGETLKCSGDGAAHTKLPTLNAYMQVGELHPRPNYAGCRHLAYMRLTMQGATSKLAAFGGSATPQDYSGAGLLSGMLPAFFLAATAGCPTKPAMSGRHPSGRCACPFLPALRAEKGSPRGAPGVPGQSPSSGLWVCCHTIKVHVRLARRKPALSRVTATCGALMLGVAQPQKKHRRAEALVSHRDTKCAQFQIQQDCGR